MGHQEFVGLAQNRDRLFAGDGRKMVEGFFEGIARHQIIEECADMDTCPNENGRTAENVGISVNGGG